MIDNTRDDGTAIGTAWGITFVDMLKTHPQLSQETLDRYHLKAIGDFASEARRRRDEAKVFFETAWKAYTAELEQCDPGLVNALPLALILGLPLPSPPAPRRW